ncbi:MAG: type II toxin-antitoxin system RelE/ParE family toxin [Hyphomicrobiales bacterium]
MRVRWVRGARRQLHEVLAELSLWSPRAAWRLRVSVRDAARQLSAFPESGRVVPEWPEFGVRELIIERHRLIYHIPGDAVEILAFHPPRSRCPSHREVKRSTTRTRPGRRVTQRETGACDFSRRRMRG